ncbi:MAG: class I SAM-dependent methyltransferase [Magnetococcales bacterium]|nr:class I SAM-dependent methyltransferase [Magnetococcales bacterium]
MSEAIRSWWNRHPMTYGEVHGQSCYGGEEQAFGTLEFFTRLDAVFHAWNHPLHGERPFSRLFPYDRYGSGSRILEVGCGLGTMAMHWANAGAMVTAVDLNPTAVAQTQRRFELMGLSGDVREADARHLPFPDDHFDYVYSWGVLHHSPDIERSVAEMMRVLRPGGGYGIMLYHRRSILQWYMTDYLEGFLHMERRFLTPLQLASRYGDGSRQEGNPHTWPLTRQELLTLLADHSPDRQVRILGTDLDSILRFLLPGLGLLLPAWAKKVWARRLGWSLWAWGHKNGTQPFSTLPKRV